MTDFLSNLVDRALDRAPVIQRRGQSLFEPTPDRVLPDRGLSELSWTQGNQGVLDETETSVMREDYPSRSTVPRLDFESVSPGLKGQRKASLVTEEIISPVESAAQRGTSPVRNVSTPLEVADTIVERGEKPEFRRGLTVKHLEPDPMAGHSDLAAQERALPIAAKTRGTTVERKISSSDHKDDSQRSIQVKQGLTREPIRPKPRPQNSPAVRLSGVRTAPVAPTVQVTIGRIEVRATTPVAAARVVQPAKPKLSLDDYLRSRSRESK